MKLWLGYGSEHSHNLVMIGHFQEVADAKRAEHMLHRLEALVNEEIGAKRMEVGTGVERFSDHVRHVLHTELRLYSVGPTELEQFAYDVRVKRADNDIVITTDEIDVSAFLKVLIDQKAKIEVYSAHYYPDDGHGRGRD